MNSEPNSQPNNKNSNVTKRSWNISTAEMLQERTRLEALEQQLLTQTTTLEQEQTELHIARERFQEQREALEQLLLQERDALATDRAQHQVATLDFQRERAAWQKCKSQAEHE